MPAAGSAEAAAAAVEEELWTTDESEREAVAYGCAGMRWSL